MQLSRVAFALLCSACFGASAQSAKPVAPVPPPPAGTVTGHVVYGDTQRPARFAQVYLMLRQDADDRASEVAAYHGRQPKQPLPVRLVMLDARTTLDGSFSMTGVPPGDYFVLGADAGYMLPVTPQKSEADAQDLDKLLAGAPVVHVVADRLAEANISLRRGGVITGRAHFDDGAPLAGMGIAVRPVEDGFDESSSSSMALNNVSANLRRWNTDDEGRFRLAGLPPGKYRVVLYLQLGNSSKATSTANGYMTFGMTGAGQRSMTLYAPGVQRLADASVIEIHGSETAPEVDLAVALGSMHAISGRLVSSADGQAVNHASIALTDPADKGLTRYTSALADGTWRIDYLPAGTYKLKVAGAQQVDNPNPLTYGEKVTTIRSFANLEQEVIVGDHDQLVGDLQLEERKPAARAAGAP